MNSEIDEVSNLLMNTSKELSDKKIPHIFLTFEHDGESNIVSNGFSKEGILYFLSSAFDHFSKKTDDEFENAKK